MTIYREKRRKEYVIMSKHHFKDYELSWKAKGILSLMLSLPDDWEFSYQGLAMMANDSIDSLKSGIKELRKKGYLDIVKSKDKKGVFRYEWEIYENPNVDFPTLDKPTMDNPSVDHPTLDKHTQLNNKELINNKLNNKRLINNNKSHVSQSSINNIYSGEDNE